MAVAVRAAPASACLRGSHLHFSRCSMGGRGGYRKTECLLWQSIENCDRHTGSTLPPPALCRSPQRCRSAHRVCQIYPASTEQTGACAQDSLVALDGRRRRLAAAAAAPSARALPRNSAQATVLQQDTAADHTVRRCATGLWGWRCLSAGTLTHRMLASPLLSRVPLFYQHTKMASAHALPGPHPPHAIPLACPQAAWRRRAARVPSAWLSWTAQRKRFWTAAFTTSTCRHAPLFSQCCQVASHVGCCYPNGHAGVAAGSASLHVWHNVYTLGALARSHAGCRIASPPPASLGQPAATLRSAWSAGRPRSRSRRQRQARAAARAGRRWHVRCAAVRLSRLSTTAMTAPISE